jgi:broad specificity phosphatase PhoE
MNFSMRTAVRSLPFSGPRCEGGSIALPASSVTTLYLARHGQSEWNNQSRITGQIDIGLSPRGRQQSEALARCLAGDTLAAIYSSALQRTIATAQPTAIAQGLKIVSMPELNEIHLGVLQGRQRDERDAEARALWAQWQADPWGYCVPGGERFDAFALRVEAGLQTILQQHRGQRVLIVGHRATNRVVLGHLLGWPRERWAELQLRNKYFYRLRLGTPSAEIATFTLSGSHTGAGTEGFVM